MPTSQLDLSTMARLHPLVLSLPINTSLQSVDIATSVIKRSGARMESPLLFTLATVPPRRARGGRAPPN